MAIPFPHTCTIKRQSASGGIYSGETTVSEDTSCLFSPATTQQEATPFGPFPDYDALLFLPAGTDIAMGDIVTYNSEDYTVMRQPRAYDNPISWTAHHIEAELSLKPD